MSGCSNTGPHRKGEQATPLACFLVLAALPVWGQIPENAQRLAPFVPSPRIVVDKMLEAARVKPNEVVYDLGCGDGRVLIAAAKEFHARAVGVEISPKLVKAATERIKEEGLEDRCKVIRGDLLKVDLSDADVVVLYLLTSSNELLRPNLEKYLKPGARVVSHDFEIRGWKPTRIETAEAYRRVHHIYVYEMPPQK
jgi:ubiquinone/menaquinone biosynthesis C-methylase UbiE